MNLATEFNPRDPEFRANPYPVYQRLRASDPIHYRQPPGDWVLTRYADIVVALKHAQIGHWEPAPELEAVYKEAEHKARSDADLAVRLRHEGQRLMEQWLLFRNPPAHTRLRALFHSTFCPRQVETLRPRIQTLADQLIDRMEAGQPRCVDIIEELAHPLALNVISGIMGVPEAALAPFQLLSRDLALTVDVDMTPRMAERSRLANNVLTRVFRSLLAQPAGLPADSLIRVLMRARAEDKLSEDEVLAHCSLMFAAGHVTTQHLIGNGLLALLRHPAQLRLLQAEPTLMPTAIQECLRYDSPAQGITHTARTDIEISGTIIRKHDRIQLMVAAGNRDPAQFAEPDRFDIRRTPNPHLSFGHGIHYCLGASLAPLVAEIALGTLLRRLPCLALAAEGLEWGETFLLHGLKALPVVF